MAKNTKNAVKNEDGTAYLLGDTAHSVVEYNDRFAALPERPRSGYDKYFNDHGFTNPESPKGLSPQGIGKLLAQLFEKAHETIRNGGTDATEMQGVLNGILAYNAIAAEVVAKNAEKAVMAEALKVVGPEKLAAFVADAKELPTPTETPAATETPVTTVAETTKVETPAEVTPTPTTETVAETPTETAVETPTTESTPAEIVPTATEPIAETPAPVVNQTETTEPVAVEETHVG